MSFLRVRYLKASRGPGHVWLEAYDTIESKSVPEFIWPNTSIEFNKSGRNYPGPSDDCADKEVLLYSPKSASELKNWWTTLKRFYNVLFNNCADSVIESLKASGFNTSRSCVNWTPCYSSRSCCCGTPTFGCSTPYTVIDMTYKLSVDQAANDKILAEKLIAGLTRIYSNSSNKEPLQQFIQDVEKARAALHRERKKLFKNEKQPVRSAREEKEPITIHSLKK